MIIETTIPATGQVLRYNSEEHDNGLEMVIMLASHGLKQKCSDVLAQSAEDKKKNGAYTDDQKADRVLAAFAEICKGNWTVKPSGLPTGLKQYRELVFKALAAKDKTLKIGKVGTTYEAITEFGSKHGIAKTKLNKAMKQLKPLDDETDLDLSL